MLRRHALFAWVALGLVAGAPLASSSYADTVALVAVRDNTLVEDPSGSLSNGEGDHFFAGRTGQDSIRRGLVAFDLGVVPTGSTIDSVAVTLHMSRTLAPDQAQDVGLHLANADWGEGGSHAFGEEGQGAPAAAGDATWLHRFFDTQLWTRAGGDFQALPSATASVDNTGFYTWSSNALLADVQGWVNDPSTNFGWVVVGNESAASTAKRFDSKDHDSASVHPRLFVSFTIPTDVAGGAGVPRARLHPNYPNPFNPGTRILYDTSRAGRVVLRLYDVTGRYVRTLVDAHEAPGTHSVFWDGTGDRGSRLASGVYTCQLQFEGFAVARRMLLLR